MPILLRRWARRRFYECLPRQIYYIIKLYIET
jgi:hypothetical protein